jgi:hypothetical protein
VKLFWMIVAGVAVVAAGVFLLRRNLDAAFVTAALGMVAWFLNYRAQMRDIAVAAEQKEENKGYQDEASEDLDDD